MGIQLSSDFSPRIKRLMDDRTSVKTLDELKALDDNIIPPGLIVFCEEDGVSYRRTLMVPNGTGDDFNLLWLPLGSGGKIEQEISSNTSAGAIDAGTVIPVNTTITNFVSMLLFEDRDPEFSCEFSVPALQDITMDAAIVNPILNINIDDMGGVTGFKRITYMNDLGTVIKQQDAIDGVLPPEAFTCETTMQIYPTSAGYKFSVKLEYDLTRTTDRDITRFFTIKFAWPIFRGISESIPTAEIDLRLLNKHLRDPESFTDFKDDVTCTNHYDIIAIPESIGNIVRILDQNGFDITDSYELSTISIYSQLATATERYNVYYTKEKQFLTNFSKRFYLEDPMNN